MIDRSTPPEPGPPRRVRFPAFERSRLSNGLEIYAAPIRRNPLVQLELISRAGGGQQDPQSRAGLATLTAGLLDEGTRDSSALELAARVEKLGGYLTSGADWDVAHVSTGMLSKHLQDGLQLLAEVATLANFPPAEVARLQRQRQAELQRRLAQPASLASVALLRLIYGTTPYGFSLLGTSQTVASITRDDILDFHRRHYGPADAVLIAVGDFDLPQIQALAEKALSGWSGSTRVAAVDLSPTSPSEPTIEIVDRPEAVQTELRLGHQGPPRSSADYAPLQVLNSLLGGKFTSRINLNLRERHGFTYGAHSTFAERLGPGPFVVSTAVATETVGRAVTEIRGELERIREEPVSQAELDDTKGYLLGVFPYSLQRLDGISSRLGDLAVYSLPDDYHTALHDEISQVDARLIGEVARNYLHPDRLAIVAVGPAEQLRAQLEPMGSTSIRTVLEVESEQPSPPTPTEPCD
jgi:zinc protease